MQDVFYTILTVWIIWRIYQAFTNNSGTKTSGSKTKMNNKDGEITIKQSPPVNKKISDDEGEYVDFEEMK
jgi:hypothetical protein